MSIFDDDSYYGVDQNLFNDLRVPAEQEKEMLDLIENYKDSIELVANIVENYEVLKKKWEEDWDKLYNNYKKHLNNPQKQTVATVLYRALKQGGVLNQKLSESHMDALDHQLAFKQGFQSLEKGYESIKKLTKKDGNNDTNLS